MAMLATGPGPKAARAPTAADMPNAGNRNAPTTEAEMAATPAAGAAKPDPDAEAAKSYIAQMANSKNAHDQRVGKFLGGLLKYADAAEGVIGDQENMTASQVKAAH